jgi:DNA polymerase-1
MKLAMVRLDRRAAADGFTAIAILQIHDELVFELPRTELDAFSRLAKYEMEHALDLSVPIEVTLKAGSNLYEIESFDLDDVALTP